MQLDFALIPLASGLMKQQAAGEVMQCNAYTQRFGLALTQAQALELVETRGHALQQTGRMEFGGGVIDKLIEAFCDSPYISLHNYTETLHALIELFYYYKNETLDLLSDDDLIAFMKASFDGVCQGSLELLGGRELHRMARNLRFGLPMDYAEGDMPEGGEGADGKRA